MIIPLPKPTKARKYKITSKTRKYISQLNFEFRKIFRKPNPKKLVRPMSVVDPPRLIDESADMVQFLTPFFEWRIKVYNNQYENPRIFKNRIARDDLQIEIIEFIQKNYGYNDPLLYFARLWGYLLYEPKFLEHFLCGEKSPMIQAEFSKLIKPVYVWEHPYCDLLKNMICGKEITLS